MQALVIVSALIAAIAGCASAPGPTSISAEDVRRAGRDGRWLVTGGSALSRSSSRGRAAISGT
jgi:hypothetical protein